MVQIRRPRGDGDTLERGEVQRRLHPLLQLLRAAAPGVNPGPPAPRPPGYRIRVASEQCLCCHSTKLSIAFQRKYLS